MKLPLLAATLLAASALCALPACKSDKEVAREVATQNVRTFQSTLDQIPGQIDRTMSSLNKLTAGGDVPNRPQLLTEFSNNLATLKSQGAQVAAEKDKAEADVQRYFRTWVKESRGISSTSDREAAYKALDAGRERTDTAMQYIRDGSSSFRALTDKLTGFQSTIKSDMSPAAISRVGSQYGLANDDAIKVKGYIARLSEQIDKTLTGK